MKLRFSGKFKEVDATVSLSGGKKELVLNGFSCSRKTMSNAFQWVGKKCGTTHPVESSHELSVTHRLHIYHKEINHM